MHVSLYRGEYNGRKLSKFVQLTCTPFLQCQLWKISCIFKKYIDHVDTADGVIRIQLTPCSLKVVYTDHLQTAFVLNKDTIYNY